MEEANLKTQKEPMRIMRKIALGLVTIQLVATSGCVNPDGTVNNTGTGALIGGTMGALIGAAAGGRHGGEAALIGGAAGLIAGALVGSAVDQRQREYLRAYYPQTYQTIQYNDAVAQQQHAASPAPQPVSQPTSSGSPPASSAAESGMVPLTLGDIKALTAAGVKPDVIKKEIDMSQSKFTSQDIADAQQANPPIDASVIEDMKSHSS